MADEACGTCIARAEAGQPANPMCRVPTLIMKNPALGFTNENAVYVCCGIAQVLAKNKGSKDRQRGIEVFAGLQPGCCAQPSCRKGISNLQCSRCHYAVYCSKQCQTTHWRTHKNICKSD